ncbi:uncharacterized protein LOC125226449 [Leguminivora glycinivorella]|nr:uncharacterized protein LOC125225812 [Leguminivora glycinivorella]XP_047986388.1 uncharacterized protein LOC125226449 [Leguminivora glycinivorella]
MKCDKCQIKLPKNEYNAHLRTNLHKSNCILKTDLNNIEIIATAFKNRIVTYRLNATQNEYVTPETFLCDIKSNIMKVVEMSLREHKSIKINYELFVYFTLPHSGKQQLKSFNTKYDVIYENTNINELFENTIEHLKNKVIEFEHRESGWSFVAISHLEVNVNKYCPMRGGTYIPLPPSVKNTKSCINIQNNDNCCFLWSILAGLYPAKNNVCRTKSYPHYSDVLNIDGMSFPLSVSDIQLFEKNNPDISICIYGLDNKYAVTGPLYRSKSKKNNHFNLLYIEVVGKGHYCLIKDLVRLVRRQVTLHRGHMHFCDSCLQFFKSDNKFKTHHCSEIVTVLPNENTVIQFKNFERKQKINFIIYADFESMLINCNSDSSKNTQNLKKHVPTCFGYYICCSHDASLNKYVSYRGEDCVKVFVEWLINDIHEIHNILIKNNPMNPLTYKEKCNYENATHCHICKQFLFGDKVRDHDHITSEYRGAAHSLCNLKYRICSFIPVVLHNLTGYDSHLFIEELAKYPGSIKIMPQSKEKYSSITKTIYSTNKSSAKPIEIKFIDSFQFLSSSLFELTKSLNKEDFVNLSKEFTDTHHFQLLTRKGVYPYDYIDSWLKYEDNKLPTKEMFYNTLKSKHISDIDYNHAETVWSAFNIMTLGEYTDLYLKCDVLLLSDVFEHFRNTSLKHYNLDPAYYVSAPNLSWDAMLLFTDVKLQLIHDLEVYQMIERGIRGGLAQCSLRNSKANNKYTPDFDTSRPTSYLMYLDCNNLYGYAMRQKLPVSDFEFLTLDRVRNFDILTIPENGEHGYILEVDMSYPDHLHDLHADLPFAPERFVPPGGKSEKLIANLYDKYNYIIHFVHLKECLKNGLVLQKIHRILRFRQSNFLQKYIDLNTRLRQEASTSFEKDFFKLLNNAIFGKTIENKRKHLHVQLAIKWKDNDNKTNKHLGAEKILLKPNVKNVSIFNENFVAVQLSPEKICLDRPIYIGFTVLELAKTHLYQFHYNFIKKTYKENVKLCYTDTDSLLYNIITDDFYNDLNKNISKYDTSNYDHNNPYGIPKLNAKVPGLFKDEFGGTVITEFIGLRAKLYCLKNVKKTITKAKGVTKPITNKLRIKHFDKVLQTKKVYTHNMNMIRSIKHVLYSQQVDKVVLNCNDDKRQILPDNIQTLPWGHCKTIF